MRAFFGLRRHVPLVAFGALFLAASPAPALTVSENAKGMGLGYFGLTQGRIPVFDANGDGHRDLLLNGHNQERWWLMLGRPDGTFAKSDGIPFRKHDLHGCVAEDFASLSGGPDGKVDLFCHVGANAGRGTKPFYKHLFVQTTPGRFVDLAQARGLGMPLDRGRDALAAHIDGDAVPDLVTAALGSPTGQSFNRAFVNRNGTFAELPAAAFPARGVPGAECMAVLPKASRFDDVLYCAKRPEAGGYGIAHFRNTRGVFREVTGAGYLRLPARKIDFADMNGDAKPDLLVLTPGELSIWFNDGADTFPAKSVSIPTSQAWALAACRIDADADLDLFVAQGKLPQQAEPQREDFALLNDGTGRRFTRFAVPSRNEPGNADWVTCLPDWRGTGYAMVYVTNGRWLLKGENRAYVFGR